MKAERIVASHIDIVSSDGTTRASLTSGDDLDGQRIAPFAGLIIRDAAGAERGGIGVIDVDGDARVASVLDHPGGDAIGSMVTDSGEVVFLINDAPAGDGRPRSTRIRMHVAANGTPSLAFLDGEGRPRLRFTLEDDGAGAIEFVRADGSVAHQMVPEHES